MPENIPFEESPAFTASSKLERFATSKPTATEVMPEILSLQRCVRSPDPEPQAINGIVL